MLPKALKGKPKELLHRKLEQFLQSSSFLLRDDTNKYSRFWNVFAFLCMIIGFARFLFCQ